MSKSITTEADIEELLDYVVRESYGSYYYERVRNSSNVTLMGKYLKLMIKIKDSSFVERLHIYTEMEQLLHDIKNDEYVDDVNTFEWVKEMLLDAGVVKAMPDKELEGECKIIPLFSKEDV